MSETEKAARLCEHQAAWNYKRCRDETVLRGPQDSLASSYFVAGSVLEAMADSIRRGSLPEMQNPNYANAFAAAFKPARP